MTHHDAARRTRRMQRFFLALLALTTAQLGWWLVDQVRYTREVRDRWQATYESDTAAARALLRSGQPWSDIAHLYPTLTISADSARISVRPEVIAELADHRFHRLNRYAWEGAFFLAVLLAAMAVVYRALREEADLRRRQEQFLAGMSHELKSPLASLRLSVETMAMRDPPPAQRGELVRRMLVELGRLQGMIANVLDTSRLAEAGSRRSPEPLSLGHEVRSIVEDLSDLAVESEVVMECDVPDFLTVTADRVGTRVVLRNLLHNAIKATPAGGRVRVRGSGTNGEVTLEVRDDGVGFAAGEEERLFEKFYRIEREERGRMQGTGLGLYLVRRNVELDAGRVWATSEGPGRGAVFTVVWPPAGMNAS